MTITFTMTPGEAAHASAAYSKVVMPKRSQAALSMVPYVFVAAVVYVVDRHMWYAGVVAFGMAAALRELLRARMQYKRVIEALTGPELTPQPTTVDVSQDGLRFTSAGVDMHFSWSAIVRVVEDSRFFLFTSHAGDGQTIPKRALSLVEDRQFRQIVIERSPDHGASLRPELTAAVNTVVGAAAA
ncbi:MAG TPA: YcxB family protein [Gemmatimonadaceae bacterium]|nr:YcxB family protein [Gemmatimonadaceae bacterium]